MLSQKMELMPNPKMELMPNLKVGLNRSLKMALKKSLKVLEVMAKGSDYGYHPCAVPPCKGYDDGDSINSGDNCAGVICTGKRSAVNIKCCGDGRRRRMR